jgi:hypothetical protein
MTIRSRTPSRARPDRSSRSSPARPDLQLRPTVYGPAHIGNFRSFLFADLLVRHLRRRGLRVTWVMNITDIDDKIIKGANAAPASRSRAGRPLAGVFLATSSGSG